MEKNCIVFVFAALLLVVFVRGTQQTRSLACHDNEKYRSDCKDYAGAGFCRKGHRFSSFMAQNCRKSCNRCPQRDSQTLSSGQITVFAHESTKCQKQRHEAKRIPTGQQRVRIGALPRIGAFIPECEVDGSYSKRQCHGSTGFCWCVDREGNRRSERIRGHIECDEDKWSKCQKVRNAALRGPEGQRRALLGAFVPKCETDGSYSEKQCHGSTGYCWCVDRDGGDRSERKRGDVECDEDKWSKCQKVRNSALRGPEGQRRRPLLGAFVPKCEEDGSYSEKQCHGSTGYCWCVDRSGRDRSERKRGHVECDEDKWSKCQKQRNDALRVPDGEGGPLLGVFVPKCEEDGSYSEKQCHGSTGFCWCVDKEGSDRSERKRGRVECDEDKWTKCQKRRNSAMRVGDGDRRPLLGAFVPKCEEDGSYSEKQCHGSTGYCWCVDRNGRDRSERKRGDVECDEDKWTKCQKERNAALRSPRLGGFTPKCEKNGTYTRKQCRGFVHGSSGYCWCVNSEGTALNRRIYRGPLECGKESKCKISDCVQCKDVNNCTKCKSGYYKQFSHFQNTTLCRSNCGFFLYPSTNREGELICISKPKVKVDSCPIDSCVRCKDVRTCAKCKTGFYKEFSPYGLRTLCRANCGIFLYPSKNEKGELFCTKKPTGPCPINNCEFCTASPHICAKCKEGFYKHSFFFNNQRTICTTTCGSLLQPSKDDKGELVCTERPKKQCLIADCETCKDDRSCAVCKSGTYKYMTPYGNRMICNSDCFGNLEQYKDKDGHDACRKRTDIDGCGDSWCLSCRSGYLLYRKSYIRSFCLKQCPSGYVPSDTQCVLKSQ